MSGGLCLFGGDWIEHKGHGCHGVDTNLCVICEVRVKISFDALGQ